MSTPQDARRTLADVALLYELALAAGTSLDLGENCRRFLTTLAARKNLDLAAVWLRKDAWPHDEPQTEAEVRARVRGELGYRLAFATPEAHVAARGIDWTHPVVGRLRRARAFAVDVDGPELAGLVEEGAPGRAAIFPLPPRGFLVLHSSQPSSLVDERELRQLEGVIGKFAISIEGCVAYVNLVREMAQRRESEAARAQIQQQLHHAQKMEAVGRLAGGVAHDFNNVLTGILGCAELLQARSTNENEAKLLDLIVSAAESAAALTSQLLAFSRRAHRELRPIALDRLVADVLALLRRTIDPRIEIDARLEIGERYVVMGDLSQLQSALLNLGVNARDAIDGNGQIGFSTGVVDIDEAFVSEQGAQIGAGRYGRVSVTDTGVGMDTATLARIFEPFFSTKRVGRGTGLGLAAVYGTISGHGGWISVKSEVGEGTGFDLWLPLTQAGVGAPPADEPSVRSGHERLLIVDDDGRVREACAQMCAHLGYDVETARDGEEALRRLAGAASAGRLPDAVILDVRMPDLGGRRTLELLRASYPELPVVVATGFVDERELGHMRGLGVQGLLAKPFTLAELSARLRVAVSARA